MPTFKDTLEIENNGDIFKIYLFDYSVNVVALETNEPKKKKGPKVKQLISMLPCMTYGTKNLTTLNEDKREPALTPGQEYNGYFVKTLNGPYDYCYKIWTDRRLPFAPLNFKLPGKDEIVDGVIIDRNKGCFGIACGPHLAYCKTNALLKIGLKSADVKLPHPGLRVKLVRITERPSEIPYVAFEAIPVLATDEGESDEDVVQEEDAEFNEIEEKLEALQI